MISKLAAILMITAAAFGETISIDTSSLAGNANAPFTLDFQLIDGSGSDDGNNTVTLSDFNFGGGSLTLVPGSEQGGVVVSNSPLQIQMTDNSFFDDVQFTIDPGSTLSFNLSATSNADIGTPDTFALAVLDSSLNNLPTSNPNNGVALVEYDLPTVDPTGVSQLILSGTIANTDGITIPTPQNISNTPEPSGLFWTALVLPALGLLRRRARSSQLRSDASSSSSGNGLRPIT
jgi:hypothetical protein